MNSKFITAGVFFLAAGVGFYLSTKHGQGLRSKIIETLGGTPNRIGIVSTRKPLIDMRAAATAAVTSTPAGYARQQ